MQQANPRVAEAHFQNSRERVRHQTCMHAKRFAAQSRGCSAGPSRPFKGLETLHSAASAALVECSLFVCSFMFRLIILLYSPSPSCN